MHKDVVCAGFVALDVIYDALNADVPKKVAAGGSACNVAMITQFLGLSVSMVGEVGADRAGDIVRDELARCGVDTNGLEANESFDTPVVVERLLEPAGGEPRHRFELRCPHCGSYFSRFRPSPIPKLENLTCGLKAKAFVFDRATPAIVKLAERLKDEGAFILFEPSSSASGKPFRRAAGLCDALKYSADRLTSVSALASPECVIIETKGSAGLRISYTFRSRRIYKDFPAKYAGPPVDVTGAGDWLTAGMLVALKGNAKPNSQALSSAVRFGQSLAAMSTLFLGARGMMDALTRRQVLRACDRVLEGQVPSIKPRTASPNSANPFASCYAG
jgi:sugar/nucleoside kinase (ribokinase family)